MLHRKIVTQRRECFRDLLKILSLFEEHQNYVMLFMLITCYKNLLFTVK